MSRLTKKRKEAKKAPVENIASAIETLDILIEPKKVIQCKAIIIPANTNFISDFRSTEILILTILI